MKSIFKILFLAALSISSLGAKDAGFIPLFDGKTLKGWTAARGKGPGDWGAFSVNEAEKAIHVYAGQQQGSRQRIDCLVTDTGFSHYILKMEYKWLENRFAPRADWDRDAGLLFNIHGDLKNSGRFAWRCR